MKKIIACSSLALALLCAPAFADDSATGNVTGSTTGNDMLQKGKNSMDSAGKSVGDTADKWASATTCTDENGVLHSRGSSGFQSCVDSKRKMDTKREQSGTVGGSTDTSPYGSTSGSSSGGAKGGMNDSSNSGSMGGTGSTSNP